MNKKVFAGIILLLMSLVILSGGCNSSNRTFSNNNNNDINSALNGTWISFNSGTITVNTAGDTISALPDEVVAQFKNDPEAYKLYQDALNSSESVTANIACAAVILENCDVSKDNGSAKLTAAILISDDSGRVPILFNGVNLTTQRSNSNKWTAKLPDSKSLSGKLTLTLNSQGSINLSGELTYFAHELNFSTVINKTTQQTSLTDTSDLNGIWKFDNTQIGAYADYDSGMLSVLNPEDVYDVSIVFENNNKMAASYFMNLTSAISVLDDKSAGTNSEFKGIKTSSGTLTQIAGNVCKFTGNDGSESLIVIDDSEKIFVFTSETNDNDEVCMFLPLKKSSGVDIESAMSKSWSASPSDGGGYVHFTNLDTESDPSLELLSNLSFKLTSCNLSFSDVTMNNDNSVTAKVNLSSVFTLTSEIFKEFLTEEDLNMDDIKIDSEQHTLTRTGNILELAMTDENEEDYVYISFISRTEALLTIEMKYESGGEYDGKAKFVAVLEAK